MDARIAAAGRGRDLAIKFFTDHGVFGANGKHAPGMSTYEGGGSWYSPVSNRIHVARGPKSDAPTPQALLDVEEAAAHETSHAAIRRAIGFPGLRAGGPPGRVGEGLAQVFAGAAMVLEGGTDEQAWGVDALDPRGDTTPVGEFGRHPIPLSTSTRDLHAGRIHWFDDMGGVHVHGGIVQEAHRLAAEQVGMQRMADVSVEALHDLHQTSGMHQWARATVAAADRLGDHAAAEAFTKAWTTVGIFGPQPAAAR